MWKISIFETCNSLSHLANFFFLSTHSILTDSHFFYHLRIDEAAQSPRNPPTDGTGLTREAAATDRSLNVHFIFQSREYQWKYYLKQKPKKTKIHIRKMSFLLQEFRMSIFSCIPGILQLRKLDGDAYQSFKMVKSSMN